MARIVPLRRTLYNVGAGAAQIGDGSNWKPAPNQYNVGSGASGQTASKQYVAGHAQNLEPSDVMGQAEQAKNQNTTK